MRERVCPKSKGHLTRLRCATVTAQFALRSATPINHRPPSTSVACFKIRTMFSHHPTCVATHLTVPDGDVNAPNLLVVQNTPVFLPCRRRNTCNSQSSSPNNSTLCIEEPGDLDLTNTRYEAPTIGHVRHCTLHDSSSLVLANTSVPRHLMLKLCTGIPINVRCHTTARRVTRNGHGQDSHDLVVPEDATQCVQIP